jgi:ABC-2 type transport system permease protein
MDQSRAKKTRAKKTVRDTWLVFQRELLLLTRQRVQIAFSLAYPVTYLLIWAPLLRRALVVHGITTYAEAYRVYVPGLLGLTAALGGFMTGFTLLAEIGAGIIERSRVTPVSRVALVLGRALREVVVLVGQAAVITLLALPLGLRVGPAELSLALALFALLAMTTVTLSYCLTLWVGNSAALGPVLTTVSQPLMLLSGMLLPLTLAPLWMLEVARENPFYWATNGLRALFAGQLGALSVWLSLAVVLMMSVLATGWTLRLFARTIR